MCIGKLDNNEHISTGSCTLGSNACLRSTAISKLQQILITNERSSLQVRLRSLGRHIELSACPT